MTGPPFDKTAVRDEGGVAFPRAVCHSCAVGLLFDIMRIKARNTKKGNT